MMIQKYIKNKNFLLSFSALNISSLILKRLNHFQIRKPHSAQAKPEVDPQMNKFTEALISKDLNLSWSYYSSLYKAGKSDIIDKEKASIIVDLLTENMVKENESSFRLLSFVKDYLNNNNKLNNKSLIKVFEALHLQTDFKEILGLYNFIKLRKHRFPDKAMEIIIENLTHIDNTKAVQVLIDSCIDKSIKLSPEMLRLIIIKEIEINGLENSMLLFEKLKNKLENIENNSQLVYVCFCENLINLGRLKEAQQIYQKLTCLNTPESVKELLIEIQTIGIKLFDKLGHLETCLQIYSSSTKEHQSQKLTIQILECLKNYDEYNKIIQIGEEFIKKNSNDNTAVEIYDYLILGLCKLNQIEDAISKYNDIKQLKESVNSTSPIIEYYLQQNNIDEALSWFNKARNLFDGSIECYSPMIKSLVENDQTKQAYNILKESGIKLQMFDYDQQIALKLIIILIQENQIEEAMKGFYTMLEKVKITKKLDTQLFIDYLDILLKKELVKDAKKSISYIRKNTILRYVINEKVYFYLLETSITKKDMKMFDDIYRIVKMQTVMQITPQLYELIMQGYLKFKKGIKAMQIWDILINAKYDISPLIVDQAFEASIQLNMDYWPTKIWKELQDYFTQEGQEFNEGFWNVDMLQYTPTKSNFKNYISALLHARELESVFEVIKKEMVFHNFVIDEQSLREMFLFMRQNNTKLEVMSNYASNLISLFPMHLKLIREISQYQ